MSSTNAVRFVRPRLLDAVVPVPISGDRIAVRNSSAGRTVLVLQGGDDRLAASCLALLDGSHTWEELGRRLAEGRAEQQTAAQLEQLLSRLDAAGVIEEADVSTSLTGEQLLRYSRNLSCFGDQVRHLGSKYAVQERLAAKRVLIIGLGGVGSSCALGLAMLGLGGLALVDFDAVEVQNLNRQVLYDTPSIGRPKAQAAADRLRSFNPHVEYRPVAERVTSSAQIEALMRRVQPDITVLAADRPLRAVDRWTSAASWRTGCPYITGTVNGGWGAVWTRIPGQTGCEECELLWLRSAAPDEYEIALRREELDLMPLTSALGVGVQIVAGLIGLDIVHYLLDQPVQSAGQRLTIDFARLSIARRDEPPHPDCSCRRVGK